MSLLYHTLVPHHPFTINFSFFPSCEISDKRFYFFPSCAVSPQESLRFDALSAASRGLHHNDTAFRLQSHQLHCTICISVFFSLCISPRKTEVNLFRDASECEVIRLKIISSHTEFVLKIRRLEGVREDAIFSVSVRKASPRES